MMCLNIGTPKTINFPSDTNGKLMTLGVPILTHFRVPIPLQKSPDCTNTLLHDSYIESVTGMVKMKLVFVCHI